jgi:hypothetical protein
MFRLAVCIVAILIDCFRQLFKRAFLAIEEKWCADLAGSPGALNEPQYKTEQSVETGPWKDELSNKLDSQIFHKEEKMIKNVRSIIGTELPSARSEEA